MTRHLHVLVSTGGGKRVSTTVPFPRGTDKPWVRRVTFDWPGMDTKLRQAARVGSPEGDKIAYRSFHHGLDLLFHRIGVKPRLVTTLYHGKS